MSIKKKIFTGGGLTYLLTLEMKSSTANKRKRTETALIAPATTIFDNPKPNTTTGHHKRSKKDFNQAITVKGNIASLHYGKFKRKHDQPITCQNEQFIICQFRVETSSDPSLVCSTSNSSSSNSNVPPLATLNAIRKITKPIEIKLLGNLPFHADYFTYVICCLKKWDESYKSVYYEILEIKSVERMYDVPTPRVVRWLILQERALTKPALEDSLRKFFPSFIVNGKLDDEKFLNTPLTFNVEEWVSGKWLSDKFPVRNITSLLSSTSTRTAAAPAIHPLFSKWLPESEFEKWNNFNRSKELVKLLPELSTYLTSTECPQTTLSKLLDLLKNPEESWKFISKCELRKIDARLYKPAKLDVVIDNASHIDGGGGVIITMDKSIREALIYYHKNLLWLRANKGQTSFVSPLLYDDKYDEFALKLLSTSAPRSWQVEKSMQLLVSPLGLLIEENVDGQLTRTFTSDYKTQTGITHFYKSLWNIDVDNRPDVNLNYKPNDNLTHEQRGVLKAIDEHPVICIHGGPGRGKSWVIAEICAKYKHVKVITRVSSLACGLRTMKNIPDASTIHMSIVLQKKESRSAVLPVADILDGDDVDNEIEEEEEEEEIGSSLSLQDAEVIVIDEFEDIDDKLVYQLFKAIGAPTISPSSKTRLLRLVQVFDPLQIDPIDPGNLAVDFLKLLTSSSSSSSSSLSSIKKKQASVIELTTPFRFQLSDTAKICSTNDEHLIKTGKLDSPDVTKTIISIPQTLKEMQSEWSVFQKDPSLLRGYVIFQPTYIEQHWNDWEKMVSGDVDDNKHLGQQQQQQRQRRTTLTEPMLIRETVKCLDILYDSNALCHRDNTELQIIALKKTMVDAINKLIEKKKLSEFLAINNNFEPIEETGERYFYANQRLIIDGISKKSKPLVRVSGNLNRGKGKKQQQQQQHQKTSSKKKGKGSISSARVDNGQIYIVQTIGIYGLKSKSWTKFSNCVNSDFFTNYPFGEERRCLWTKCGKIICVHPDFLSLNHIKPGWAITVDKSKGLEYNNVLFVPGIIPPHLRMDRRRSDNTTTVTDNGEFFGLKHCHVALTRSKGDMMILGHFKELERMAGTSRVFNKSGLNLTYWRLNNAKTLKHAANNK